MRFLLLFVLVLFVPVILSQPLPNYLNVTFIASVGDPNRTLTTQPQQSLIDDHIYVVGFVDESFMNKTTNTSTDILIFQLLRNGSLGWFSVFGSNYQDLGYSIISDSNNSLYISGLTYAPWSFNGIMSHGSPDVFVCKIAKNNGTILASILLGNMLEDKNGGIAYCPNDNSVVVSWTDELNHTIITKVNGNNLNTIWNKDTNLIGRAAGLYCNSNGVIYVTGTVNSSQIMYLKLSSSGTILLSSSVVASTGYDSGNNIIKSGSNIYITGFIGGDFMGHTFQGSERDPIIVWVDEATGAYQSHIIINATSNYDEEVNIVVDKDGNLLVQGRRGEIYLHKLNSTLSLIWSTIIQGSNLAGLSIDPFASNVIYLGAQFTDTFYNLTNQQTYWYAGLEVVDATASVPSPSPSATPSVTPSPSSTPSRSPSNTPTSSVTPSRSVTPTASVTPSVTPSPTASTSSTPSTSPSASSSPSVTPSTTPSVTPSSSVTPSVTPSNTPSLTPSPSVTPTASATPSVTPSCSSSPSVTPTSSATPSVTPSSTSSPSVTPTPSITPTMSPTSSISPSITPTPEKQASNTDAKKKTAGIAAGVVVGVFGSAALIFLGCFVYRRRTKTQPDDNDSQHNELVDLNDIAVEPKKDEYDIEIKEVIGSGSFGEVFRGVWKGTQEVALKRLKLDDKMDEFLREASMLQKCSFDHVVKFIGLHRSNGDVYMVTEFMSGGALNSLLQKEGKTLPVKTLIEMARDAAEGIKNMANMGMVHRDLAARNLLVHEEDGKYTVKVADFGLARLIEGNYYKSTKSVFPIKWSAPEVLKFEKFSAKSDVWSFGIVLWEIFENGSLPYRGMDNNESTEAVLSGYRLPQPNRCPDAVYKLMLACWSEQPEDRPTFDAICDKLDHILKEEEFEVTKTPETTQKKEDTFYANRTDTPK